MWATRAFKVNVPSSEDGTRLLGEDIAYDFMFQLTINLSFTCPEQQGGWFPLQICTILLLEKETVMSCVVTLRIHMILCAGQPEIL